MNKILKILWLIISGICTFYVLILIIIYSYNYITYYTEINEFKNLYQETELKIWAIKHPFIIMSDPKSQLNHTDIIITKDSQNARLISYENQKDYEKLSMLGVDAGKNLSMTFQQGTSRILEYKLKYLYDINSDDIWDYRRIFDENIGKTRYEINLNGEWKECSGFNPNTLSGIIDNKTIQWNSQTETWQFLE